MSEMETGMSENLLPVPRTGATQNLEQIFGSLGSTFISMGRNDPKFAETLARCELEELPTIEDVLGKELYVEHVYCSPASKIGEDGQIWDGFKVVTISPDGGMVMFFSSGVRKSIGVAMAAWGLPPWRPALVFVPEMRRLSGARQYYQLRPLGPAVAKSVKRGRGPNVKEGEE